jgi:hypothetical protein
MDGNETFDPSALGTAEEVAETRVADDSMVSQLHLPPLEGWLALAMQWQWQLEPWWHPEQQQIAL